MKRVLPALIGFLIVFGVALLRPRLAPVTRSLPVSSQGVILIAVEGLGIAEARTAFARTKFSACGLMPTRNGTIDDGDFDAGLRMILSGSRSPDSGAETLIEIAQKRNSPLRVHILTGTNAVRDAATLVTELTAPSRVPAKDSILLFGVTPSSVDLRSRQRVAPVLFWSQNRATDSPLMLTSPSTRHRPGLVAATDLASTVATLLDLPLGVRRVGDGRPIEMVPFASHGNRNPDKASLLLDSLQGSAATWGLQAREQKRLPALPWILAALFVIAEIMPRASIRRVARAALLSAPIGIIGLVSLVPVPTASDSPPDWLIYLFAAIWTTSIVAIAVLRPRWGDRLPRLLATVTVFAITLDICAGGFHLSRTPLSYSVLEAARFYGIGNEVSGLFLGAAIVAVGTGQSTPVTILWGLTVAAVLGAPSLGADAGGFIAALVAFATLVFVQGRGKEAGQKRLPSGLPIAAVVAIVGAITAFALWDAGRPASTRTHVGQAIASAREKGSGVLTTIAQRKIRVNVRLLVTSPWAVLLYTQTVLLVWRNHKRKRQGQMDIVPAADALTSTLVVTMFTLFVLNDSGVVAGAMCGCWCSGFGRFAGTGHDPSSVPRNQIIRG